MFLFVEPYDPGILPSIKTQELRMSTLFPGSIAGTTYSVKNVFSNGEMNMACYFPYNQYQYLDNYPIDVSFRKPYQLLTCKLYLNSPPRRAICFDGVI